MLINRHRLIESIQNSSLSEHFTELLETLNQYRFKDLLLANVLLETQSFKVMPFAFQSLSPEDPLSPEDQASAMMMWVLTSNEGIHCRQTNSFKPAPDELDELFFTKLSAGEPCVASASEVIEQLLDQTCESSPVLMEPHHVMHHPQRKSAFYYLCKKLDCAIAMAKASDSPNYH